jgi:hypothetical protein
MRVVYKLAKFEVEVDGDSTRDCFDKISSAVEIMSNSRCGACDSENVIPVVRENAGNHYREMSCIDCGCRLAFGQRRADGEMFPKKKDKEGSWLPNRGWVKWQPRENTDDLPNF